MKITETFKNATGPHYDNAGPWELEIVTDSGVKDELSVNEGEPEDNSFGRDLSFVFSIIDLLRIAYEAGKAGEEFNYTYVEKKEEDE